MSYDTHEPHDDSTLPVRPGGSHRGPVAPPSDTTDPLGPVSPVDPVSPVSSVSAVAGASHGLPSRPGITAPPLTSPTAAPAAPPMQGLPPRPGSHAAPAPVSPTSDDDDDTFGLTGPVYDLDSTSATPVAVPGLASPHPAQPPAATIPTGLPTSGPAAGAVPGLRAPAAQPITAPPVSAAPVVAPAVTRTAGPVLPTAASAAGVQSIDPEHETANVIQINELLSLMLDHDGSDLHLSAGAPPAIRVRGDIRPLQNQAVLDPESLQTTIYGMMNSKQRKVFEEKLELNFAHTVPGVARFRVNVFKQRNSVGSVMRAIPWEIKSLETLGLPDLFGEFANMPRGLVLVTGPTGSGKSTTLAAIIDKANRDRQAHIMTIEDPIEFLHQHRSSIVNQREVGDDTHSFAEALKQVLRQDPDIILVGELRDLETISVALTAAETGHLVFATLHTQSAQETITRIVDVFPASSQAQVQTQLAASLQAVVCQELCKTSDGKGRTAALEIMIADSGIRSMIREHKLHQIPSALQTGAKKGMQTMNAHLAELVREGRITPETGYEKCSDVADFHNLVGGDEGIARARRILAQRAEAATLAANNPMPGMAALPAQATRVAPVAPQ